MKTPEAQAAEWVNANTLPPGHADNETDFELCPDAFDAYLAGRNAGIEEAANVCPDCFPATRRSILELKTKDKP